MTPDQDQAEPIRHIDEDGSIYAAEIVLPEQDGAKYHVDLVRASVDDYGLGREQRLTVGQYGSWTEAEEHLHEVEDGLAENGLDALGDDAGRLREQPFAEDVFYLTAIYPPEVEGNDRAVAHLLAVGERSLSSTTLTAGERTDVETLIERVDVAFAEEGHDAGLALAQQEAELNSRPRATPLFDPDDGAVRHVDGGGTAHWFAVVANNELEAEPYELRYFRALEMGDGTQRDDSYPVMPLSDDDPGSAWPLRGLEMYLEKGDVYMAQQFAHDVADAYGADFPEPHDLPALDPRPEYYFGYGVSDANKPSLEVVKTWMEGSERRFDTLTVGEYGMYEEAAVEECELETLMDEKGIEAALNLAESMAVAGGYLDPQRDDPRIFFEDGAPPDPFTTVREREMPDYGFGAISANGEHFIDVVKSWGDDEYERLTIPQPTWEDAQLGAEMAFTDQRNGDLQAAMRRIEALAEDAGVLDPERTDGRLFTQGPPDIFETQREQDIRENPFLYGDTSPELEHDLTDDFNPFLDDEQPDVAVLDTVYNRLDVREAQTSDGQPLGYVVIASAYPQLPPEFAEEEEIDDTMYPTEAWALPVAHMADEQEAQDYREAFRDGSLTDVITDAEAHGLPTTWQKWDMFDINDFMSGAAQEMQAGAWHPEQEDFNPFLDRFDPMSPDEADPNILRPLDDTVNYGVQVMDVDPDTIELSVEKYWNEPNGFLGLQSVTLQTYDSQSEHGREQALADQAFLLEFHADNGLQAMMNCAENMAAENGYLDPERDDPRLFTNGPPDRFETLRENPFLDAPPAEAENPYWRMESLPVNDPDGEALGHALHMVVYPHVEHDPERVGTPAMAADEPFRLLEMAHFETTEAADKFGREFNGYLMPGVLEGPELAQEVARLEGLPVEWRTLDGDDLTAYQNLTLTLTRDPADWHPYNPNAERDARIEAEGLYTDPIQGIEMLDEGEDEPKIEPVSPDFDL